MSPRTNPKVDDKLQATIDRPYASEQDHADAYAYLQRRHAEGRLAPIHGWTGDLVAGYVSILGVKA
jgi:hypothetical protein